ncbi:MAG: DNA polymerase III subunit beta [Candidatus Yanofskybacteria bacterium RIFCSPHIGHO2_01_FULL_45_42]|uniref:Beta sliding clamp n=2 Tax=Candidatus Yanofskyibacteriota TaxID=1752733 RepID=A0A1F8H2X3_9BACT|nr:MAG: DNA polymerase III subunit beta [Candidatus Yanofskybacteria bacterium RIFCSPHIGHO2_01_FULL_45_42]OGN26634.1 MAG: DNA polymerase III subunit beta [Candidatus Yanofskybacteria bacterium RIFCSPLOWO2_01_FULL_45_72]OGN31977.1 MAG: DNA polymerase III subunit beta [Candidatus Yanofskybacteria bacterium RIFCSPLOWO2_02_FULL_45_18]
MKVIISQKNLNKALNLAEKIVGKNGSLPILNNILIKTENGRLKISATNLEMGINCYIGAKIEEIGELTVPARIFSDFINGISDEKVSLVSKNNILTVNSEKYKTQIYGLSGEDFPIIPKIKEGILMTIQSEILKNAFESVIDSVAISETRPELSGIYISTNNQKISFVATDSFRLAEKIVSHKSEKNMSFILPRNAAAEMIRICSEFEGNILIKINENQISFSTEDFELVSRLVEGNYPDYKKVIPEKIISKAVMEKEIMERVIRLAGLFSSNIADIKVIFTEKEAEFLSKNSGKGEIKAKATVSLTNSPFDMSVNYRYLLDGLKILKNNKIAIKFTGQGNPIILQSEKEDEGILYLVMPLRS